MTFPIDITQYLPHRAPMLMVDEITYMDADTVVTRFRILADNIFLDADGHFSEAGLVENAAQTCSAIVARGYYLEPDGKEEEGVDVIGFISAIKSLKLLGSVAAGREITTSAVLKSRFVTDEYTLCTMSCTTKAGTALLLEGEINLFLRQQPAAVVKSNA